MPADLDEEDDIENYGEEGLIGDADSQELDPHE